MMFIKVTQNLAINETTISDVCRRPFKQVHAKLVKEAEEEAAKKYVAEHHITRTLKELPPYIQNLLPKTSHLVVLERTNRRRCIDVGTIFQLQGLTFSGPDYYGTSPVHRLVPELSTVIDARPESKETIESAAPLLVKSEDFQILLNEYLNAANFTSHTQLLWSFPELCRLLLNITGTKQQQQQHHGRRASGMQIFLARLNDRTYIDPTKKRRPQKVHYPSDTLKTYVGEANILNASLKD